MSVAALGNEVETLSEQVRKEPGNLAVIDRLIAALERRGDLKAAAEWISYRRGLEENSALRRKAFAIERKFGTLTLEKEIEELAWMVRDQPSDLDFRLELGSALLRSGETIKAVAQLQRARKHQKLNTRAEALVTLAQAYDSLALPDLGEKSRNQALEFAREDESLQKEILYQMAISLESQDRVKEARQRWLELFELDAEFKDVSERILQSNAGH